MSSYTVSITGASSTLRSVLFPALRLQKDKEWEIALLDLTTYNSIPNVIEDVNNKFHYYEKKTTKGYSKIQEIKLSTGSYEIDNINEVLQGLMGQDNVLIKGNNNTLKSEVKSKYYIDFTQNGSIGQLLGFDNKTPILEPNKTHVGKDTVTIIRVSAIDITCNIIQGSYRNGENKHILHTFYLSVPPGFKIIERPHNLVYLPLNTHYVSEIVLNLLDQDGNLINLRGETVVVRLHIRSID